MAKEVYRRAHRPHDEDGKYVLNGDTRYEFLPDEPQEETGKRYLWRPGRIVVHQDDVDLLWPVLGKYFDSQPVDSGLDFHVYAFSPGAEDAQTSLPAILEETEDFAGGLRTDHVPRFGPLTVLLAQEHGDGGPHGPAKPPDQPLPNLPTRAGGELPGTGVRVAVLDTGVYTAHPWPKGRIEFRPGGVDEDFTHDFDPETGMRLSGVGHGTFVAGCVLLCAPGATVVVRKVLAADGDTDDKAVADALIEMINIEPPVDIVNLSLGGYTFDDRGLAFVPAALDRLFAERPGIVVVAAAGNDSLNDKFFPAADPRVIGVGAIEAGGDRAGFSNYGEWVDAYTLGVDIKSSFVEWLNPDGTPAPGAQPPFAIWSGTSFASPTVAGMIARTMRPRGDIPPHLTAEKATKAVVRDPGLPRPRDIGARVARTVVV